MTGLGKRYFEGLKTFFFCYLGVVAFDHSLIDGGTVFNSICVSASAFSESIKGMVVLKFKSILACA